MMLSVIKAIYTIANKRFESMLLAGSFPEIKYSATETPDGVRMKSYSLFEYSNTWATFMRVLDRRIKETLNDNLGIFSRKHSSTFLADVQTILDKITEVDVLKSDERFRSFADGVMDVVKADIERERQNEALN